MNYTRVVCSSIQIEVLLILSQCTNIFRNIILLLNKIYEVMKAVLYYKYGGPEVLNVKEVKINAPKKDEVLIKNYASSITTADTFIRKGEPKFGRLFLGIFRPKNKMIGTGFSGVIKEVGSDVSKFKIGDKVYGETTFGYGTNAEYVCVNSIKNIIQILPEGMSFEEATAICDGALTSFNFLIDIGKLNESQHILINGASGALGTAAIQIAKSIGAKVTAVCSSQNIELVKNLGADHVIDYTKNDFTQNYGHYDIVYDAIGKSSFSKSKKALKNKGMYLSPVLSLSLLMVMIRVSIFGKKKAKFQATGLLKIMKLNQFLDQIDILIRQGKLTTVIDRKYSIEEISKAHRYVDSGRKRGNVVIVFE